MATALGMSDGLWFRRQMTPADASNSMADTDPPGHARDASVFSFRPFGVRGSGAVKRAAVMVAVAVAITAWYLSYLGRVKRAHKYSEEAAERWEGEGGATLPRSAR
jgi:hypothetical protein